MIFDHNTYYKAFAINNPNLTYATTQTVVSKEEGKLEKYVNYHVNTSEFKENLTFSYGKEVKYKDFKLDEYDPQDTDDIPCYFGRKIFPISMTIGIVLGVVVTIYHLAKALIYRVIQAYTGDKGLNFKVNLYNAKRDVEEGFGWFIRVFNDKYGAYLSQRAKFHKNCYELYLQKE